VVTAIDDKLLSECSVVSIDVESTGFSHTYHDIVELGAVKFHPTYRQFTEVFSTLVNPGRYIPKSTSSIHGITDSMVVGSPNPVDAVANLILFSEDADFIIAHNSKFDTVFINKYTESDIFSNIPVIDTIKLAKLCFSNYNIPSYALSSLVEYFNLDYRSPHRALSDAMMCASVFNRCIEELEDCKGDKLLKSELLYIFE